MSGLVGNSRRHVLSCRGSFKFFCSVVPKINKYVENVTFANPERGIIAQTISYTSIGDFPNLHCCFRYGKDIHSVEAECRVMEADIVMQMSIAEAMKSRETGQF